MLAPVKAWGIHIPKEILDILGIKKDECLTLELQHENFLRRSIFTDFCSHTQRTLIAQNKIFLFL